MPAGLLLASQLGRAAEPPPLALLRAQDSLGGAALGASTTATAIAANMALYLEVSLNQTGYGPPQPFELRDGRLYASVATLRAIGFGLDDHDSGESLALDSLAGVAVRYDAANQRVAIDAPLSLLSLATARLNAPGADVPVASASPGLLLNYDLYSSRDRRGDSTSAFAELRAFGLGGGVFSQTAVTRYYRNEGEPRRTDSVRLDSSWRWSSPAATRCAMRMRRWRGDCGRCRTARSGWAGFPAARRSWPRRGDRGDTRCRMPDCAGRACRSCSRASCCSG